MSDPSRASVPILSLLVLISGALASPEGAKAQGSSVGPVVGVEPEWVAGFGGDAWEGMDGSVGISVIAGVRIGSWRIAAVGARSGHHDTDGLSERLDLTAVAGEIRREIRLGSSDARVYLGGRAGIVHQQFDDDVLAVVDLVPGTEVTSEDTGVLFGPVAGLSVPVRGPFGLEVTGSYQWADVTPFLLGPDEPEPGLSRVLSFGVAFTAGF